MSRASGAATPSRTSAPQAPIRPPSYLHSEQSTKFLLPLAMVSTDESHDGSQLLHAVTEDLARVSLDRVCGCGRMMAGLSDPPSASSVCGLKTLETRRCETGWRHRHCDLVMALQTVPQPSSAPELQDTSEWVMGLGLVAGALPTGCRDLQRTYASLVSVKCLLLWRAVPMLSVVLYGPFYRDMWPLWPHVRVFVTEVYRLRFSGGVTRTHSGGERQWVAKRREFCIGGNAALGGSGGHMNACMHSVCMWYGWSMHVCF